MIRPGDIYLAPPDYHLLIENDRTVSLDGSEKIQYSRPSIDVTFQLAADVYKEKLVAILLSGANADGAAGIAYIKTWEHRNHTRPTGSSCWLYAGTGHCKYKS